MVFYPEANPGRSAYNRAKAVCATCPVIQRCLQFALANMEGDPADETVLPIGAHGCWGGTSPKERFKMLGKAWAA